MKQYYLTVNGKKIYVSEKVYKAYWSDKNKENRLRNLDKKNKLMFFSQLTHQDENKVFEIPDTNIDIEKIVETKMRINDLYYALNKLNEEERLLIESLYFNQESLYDVAEKNNSNTRKISQMRDDILDKLKDFMGKM